MPRAFLPLDLHDKQAVNALHNAAVKLFGAGFAVDDDVVIVLGEGVDAEAKQLVA